MTPRGKKARGVLAILALAPGYCRSRQWLQDKLWSDRAPEQAAGSLRQALTEIRRNLGDHREVLETASDNVSLNTDKFSVVFEPAFDAVMSDVELELFEDLDIRDPEFENWIRDQRLNHTSYSLESATARQPKRFRPLVLIQNDGTDDARTNWLYDSLGDQIAFSLLEYSDAKILDGNRWPNMPVDPHNRAAVVIVLGAHFEFGTWNISARIEHFWSKEILWSGRVSTPPNQDLPVESLEVHKLIFEIVIKAMAMLTRQADENPPMNMAMGLSNRAWQKIFSLDRAALIDADEMLKLAYELEPRGQYLAWRSFVRNTAVFEHRNVEIIPEPQSSLELSYEALKLAPENAIVLALTAQTHILSGDSAPACLAFAQKSIEANPSNPLGWAFAANAELYSGKYDNAYETALQGRSLVGKQQESYFWEFICCMAACGKGDYASATQFAERSLAFSPRFRAPMRYLYALYSFAGRQEDALKITTRLKQVEPDFSPELFLDPTYPVGTLRRLPLIDKIGL